MWVSDYLPPSLHNGYDVDYYCSSSILLVLRLYGWYVAVFTTIPSRQMRRVRLSIVQQQIIFAVVRATVILSQDVFQAHPLHVQTIVVVTVWRVEDGLYVLIHGRLLLQAGPLSQQALLQGETLGKLPAVIALISR